MFTYSRENMVENIKNSLDVFQKLYSLFLFSEKKNSQKNILIVLIEKILMNFIFKTILLMQK